MPEYAMDSLPDTLNGRLQNSPPGGVITAACTREVVRCNGCFLVQFRTSSDLCRRCANPLLPQPPPDLGEAGGPGNGETIPTVSVASSSKRIFRDDPRLRGELTRKLALGCRFRELRKLRNWTQAQIAAKTGVPRSYISRIEHSHLLPGPAMVRRLAEALEVKFLDLFQNAGNADNDPGSQKNLFWNMFACDFQQLQTEQKARVLYRVRAMLCERLHHEYRSQRRRPLPASRFRLRARSA